MSKKTTPQSNSSSSANSDKSYEVEKIVNQRVVNGKKQYKVIWTGYTFEEATWEPQENLKCPEKINEFLKRYQDVIRRKNLMNKTNPQNSTPSTSANNIKRPEGQKISLQRLQQPVSQPKNIPNQAQNLNKQKLQESLQKSTLTKRPNDIENLKAKIMNPVKGSSSFKPGQSEQMLKNPNQTAITTFANQRNQEIYSPDNYSSDKNSNLTNKIIISSSPNSSLTPKQTYVNGNSSLQNKINSEQSAPSKVIKIQQNAAQLQEQRKKQRFGDQKIEHREQQPQQKGQDQKNLRTNNPNFDRFDNSWQRKQQFLANGSKSYQNQQITEQREQYKANAFTNLNEAKSSKDESNPIFQEEFFIHEHQRLQIQKILGLKQLQIRDWEESTACEQGTCEELFEREVFYLVKNKYSETQKYISQQRLFNEQTVKLIEFYEQILLESENN